jgi:hypothetical protein
MINVTQIPNHKRPFDPESVSNCEKKRKNSQKYIFKTSQPHFGIFQASQNLPSNVLLPI